MADNIDKLYENYGILADAKEDIAKHEKEYLEILAAVKGSDKEKRLASQFIAKFFNSFPNLSEQAIEAQFDLCEDEDVTIRKQAIKDLPSLCKDNKDHTQRIADILAQLLQSDDPTEINIVTNSFLTILKSDTKNALTGLFTQIHQAGDETVRQRCIKFLSTKVKQLGREVLIKESEDVIIVECKKILQDVVAEEFEYILDILTWSRLGKTPAGRKELMEIIATIAFTPEEWHPEDPDCIDRLVQCSTQTLPLFSSQVESTRFVNFYCKHVLPRWDEVPSEDTKLELLKMFAELMEHCGKLENPQDTVDTIYNLLMKYLPEAPVEVEEPKPENGDTEKKAEETNKDTPSLQFTHVEAALYAFHAACSKTEDPAVALSSDANRLRALRLKLQYTARLTQGYIKKLKEVTQGKKVETEENKLKIAALKTTSNINSLIRDIFRTPPSFKTKILLSFQSKKTTLKDEKPERVAEPESTGSAHKRHQPITFNNGDGEPIEKRRRSGDLSRVYTPPSGKYSSKLNNGGRYTGPRKVGGGGAFRRKDFKRRPPYRSNY